MVVKVGPEIEQLVFEICRRPEQQVIHILASKVPISLSTNGWDRGTKGMDLISVTSSIRRLTCHWWNR